MRAIFSISTARALDCATSATDNNRSTYWDSFNGLWLLNRYGLAFVSRRTER